MPRTVVARAAAVLRRDPETPVLVKADERVPYGRVVSGDGAAAAGRRREGGIPDRSARVASRPATASEPTLRGFWREHAVALTVSIVLHRRSRGGDRVRLVALAQPAAAAAAACRSRRRSSTRPPSSARAPSSRRPRRRSRSSAAAVEARGGGGSRKLEELKASARSSRAGGTRGDGAAAQHAEAEAQAKAKADAAAEAKRKQDAVEAGGRAQAQGGRGEAARGSRSGTEAPARGGGAPPGGRATPARSPTTSRRSRQRIQRVWNRPRQRRTGPRLHGLHDAGPGRHGNVGDVWRMQWR